MQMPPIMSMIFAAFLIVYVRAGIDDPVDEDDVVDPHVPLTAHSVEAYDQLRKQLWTPDFDKRLHSLAVLFDLKRMSQEEQNWHDFWSLFRSTPRV